MSALFGASLSEIAQRQEAERRSEQFMQKIELQKQAQKVLLDGVVEPPEEEAKEKIEEELKRKVLLGGI